MNKFSKTFALITGIGFISIASYNCQCDEVVIRIDDLTVAKTYKIPLKQQTGWVTRSIEIIENTADDTVYLSQMTKLAPRWTGVLYRNDEIDAEPSSLEYKPYKAPKGSLSIRWRVCK